MSSISTRTIEKAIILVCKNHFGGTKENLNKLINYVYHFNTKQPTLISTKTKFLRELFNRYTKKSYEHQLEDVERILEHNRMTIFDIDRNKTYFDVAFDYYECQIGQLKVNRIVNKDVLISIIDLNLSEEETKQIKELLEEK